MFSPCKRADDQSKFVTLLSISIIVSQKGNYIHSHHTIVMSNCPDMTALRRQLQCDRTALKEAEAGLAHVRSSSAKEIRASDRNQVINWSRSSTYGFNRLIEDLEDIAAPTAEDRETMRLLNELLLVGDNLVMIINEVLAEFEAKRATVDGSTTTTQLERGGGVDNEKAKDIKQLHNASSKEVAGNTTSQAAQPEEPTTTIAVSLSAGEQQVQRSAKDLQADTCHKGVTNSSNGPIALSVERDPKGVYALLGLTPAASMADIQK